MSEYVQYAASTASPQAWSSSSFLTSEDMVVLVTRFSAAVANGSVTIGPTTLLNDVFGVSYDDSDDKSVYITIPYSANG